VLKKFRLRLSIFTLLSLAVFGNAAMAATAIGNVIAVAGAPTARGDDGTRKLVQGEEVFEGDSIIVTTGNAQIVLKDGTRLVVGPDSTLLLDQYVFRGKTKAQTIGIKALRGTYRFITGKSGKSAYKITTAHATIGIRGTGFDFWVREKTGVAVLQGSVALSGLQSGTVRVDAGCELGVATATAARQAVDKEKSDTIKKNLPYLLNQSDLNKAFRLPIAACQS
jgi:hypothetical protein